MPRRRTRFFKLPGSTCFRTLLCFLFILCSTTLAGEWEYLSNNELKIGLKMSSGGAIGWLSQAGAEENLINHFDHGRLLQQSYYGKKDDSNWAGKPWRWNPVQGGDYLGKPARILEFSKGRNQLYVKTRPRHWASGEEINEVIFEQWVSLEGAIAKLKFRMTYTGQHVHPKRDQEIPAVFVNRQFDTLVIGG